MQTKTSEALAKLRAKVEELAALVKAGEISQGFQLLTLGQEIAKVRRSFISAQDAEALRELVPFVKAYNEQADEYEERPELTADKETRQRLAREGLQKLAAILEGIDNKQKAGTISKAKAQKMKRDHLRALDFDPYTLDKQGEERQTLDKIRAELFGE